jgi:hypothetical protein
LSRHKINPRIAQIFTSAFSAPSARTDYTRQFAPDPRSINSAPGACVTRRSAAVSLRSPRPAALVTDGSAWRDRGSEGAGGLAKGIADDPLIRSGVAQGMAMKLYDVVRLTRDVSKFHLKRGDRGTIVMAFTEPTIGFMVEFVVEKGKTLAVETFEPEFLELTGET